mmetsp:Transcript_34561/g.68037  ORF Transcript_34561/g.68037 Transcript_34561/m.68037 type:complete len:133 (+) Transcript_34561:140-538(+)
MAPPPPALTPPSHAAAAAVPKVKIHVTAVGSAPILKRCKFLLPADAPFRTVHSFLRKQLRLDATAPAEGDDFPYRQQVQELFLYLASSFVPDMDQRVGDLVESFGSAIAERGGNPGGGRELVVSYSLQEAWG